MTMSLADIRRFMGDLQKTAPYASLHWPLLIAMFVLLSLAPPLLGTCAAEEGNDTKPVLRVATRIVPPLVAKDDKSGKLSGFSIDLWQAIARESGYDFEFVERGNLPDVLDSVKHGQADVGIAAISITAEREELFDFSQPILESGLQILVPARSAGPSLSVFLNLITSPVVLEIAGMIAILAILPAPIIWYVERRHREGIVEPESGLGGLFKSIWWSAATLAGQAEEMPRSVVGRVIAIACMLASVLFISYFTASAATILTVRQLETSIRSAADLPGKHVGTVRGSTAAAYLRQERIMSREFARIDEAFAALERDDLDAVVYDAPILLYHASHAGRGKVQAVGQVFRKEDYGILFASGSALRKPVNAALLKLRESGFYASLHENWFGGRE